MKELNTRAFDKVILELFHEMPPEDREILLMDAYYGPKMREIIELYNTAIVVWEPSLQEYDFLDYVRPSDYIVAYRFNLCKGWLITVTKQFRNYKLSVNKSSLHFYDDSWCYDHIVDALVALFMWDPCEMEEPLGWIRNPRTARRRAYDEHGNLAREWINP